jgi:hypothetical protein
MIVERVPHFQTLVLYDHAITLNIEVCVDSRARLIHDEIKLRYCQVERIWT